MTTKALGIRAGWLEHLLSTTPTERSHAAAAVRDVYSVCELPRPRHFF